MGRRKRRGRLILRWHWEEAFKGYEGEKGWSITRGRGGVLYREEARMLLVD